MNLQKHTGYREATEKLHELNVRRNQLLEEDRSLTGALSKPNDIRDEAEALLHDSLVSSAVVTRDQLAQVRHEQRVVAEAIAMQKQVVEQARGAASTMILDQVRPRYKAITKRTADILAALRDVAIEERELRGALCDNDVSLTNEFILPYGDCGDLATGDERYDSIARWEKQARAAEMI